MCSTPLPFVSSGQAEQPSCTLLQDLQKVGEQVLQLPPTECELLYGRCGYIYSLLFARKYLGANQRSSDLIKQLLKQIVEEGQRGAAELRSMHPDSKWSLMWSWHGSYYLGGTPAVLMPCPHVCLNKQTVQCTSLACMCASTSNMYRQKPQGWFA